jgi:hypothetical protein
MLPLSLLNEAIVRSDGVGPVIDSFDKTGKLLVLTLDISRIVEQESLAVSIWGSPDGVVWGLAPLDSFPYKFYCGTYSRLLNLAAHPEIRYLSVRWKINHRGRPGSIPMVGFHVEAEESGSRIQRAVA